MAIENGEQPQTDVRTFVNSKESEVLPLLIEVEYADRVNFAMQQDGVPLVERISLTNNDEAVLENVVIKVTLENGDCTPWSQQIDRIDSGNIFNIEPDDLRLSARSLATRTEAERTALLIVVESNGRSVCKDFPIELLAFDQWPGVGLYPELLAAFVTPNHPKVAEMLADARKSLGDLSDGQDSLDGYQSGNRQRAAQIAEACFNAVLTRGIGYISLPASFDREGQRVRLVDRICRENFGSCLDLSLLLSSLWEQVGLHPLVLMLEGHAMPAVWTHESHLPEPAIDEAARIRNLIELGEIVPVESTLVTQSGATFAAAVDSAKKRMQTPGSGFCAVDILSGRKRGVRPLPLRTDAESTELDLKVVDAGTKLEAADTLLDRVALADRAERKETIDSTSQEEETGSDRIERWKTRLLDLSLRNRLINFRQTGRTIRLMVPDVALLEDMLADEKRFSIYPKTDGDEDYLRQELDARQVYTSEAPAETQKRLLQLYRTSRSSIEETGANLLHIAIGMLKWFESESSETPRYAPLILLPVKLIRNSTGFGYRYDFELSDEPLRPNVTLLEKLRKEFGIETDGLDDLPEDEHGLDVPLILRNFRAAIRDTSRWEVEESVYLGLFSFNKFLMWRDLQENMDRLRQNRLVQHFVDREQKEFDSDPFPRPEDLDDQVKPGELYCTRDADATQLAAIRAAADKRTFVLEGPPGTGKSQTIANIIADSLARGKRVLFVAEKMAALSVVRHRLEEDGLGPFCLELHSAKASKKDVLAQLQSGLNVSKMIKPPEWAQLCEELSLSRDQLNTYVRELHELRATGESLFRVLGRLSLLGEGPRITIPIENLIEISKEQLGIWRHEIALLKERAETIDPVHENPLRGIGRSEWSFSLPEEVRDCLLKATNSVRQLDEHLSSFLDAVGIIEVESTSFGRDTVQVLAIMANQLLKCPMPDARLLTGTDAEALIADIHQLIEQGKLRDAKRNDLLSRYRDEYFDLDHLIHLDAVNRAARLPGPLRFFAGFFARRKFRPYCTAKVPDLDTLRLDLETAREFKKLSAKLASAGEAVSVLGRRWNNGEANWDELEKLMAWCEHFRKAAEVLHRTPNGNSLVQPLADATSDAAIVKAVSPSAKELVKAWNGWMKSWNELKQLLITTGYDAFGTGLEIGWLSRVDDVLHRWSDSIPQLNDWCAWRRARDSATKQGLTDLIEQYERGELKRDQLNDVFERSFGEKWFTAIANSTVAIREFNAGAHTNMITRFRRIDQLLIDRTHQMVVARLSERMPARSSQASAQSELGILRRELEKKRRHLPTRRLIEAMPNLLPRLKPCFLMSPLSIAQYLNTNLPPFDLVIFDEASQIPVWDSIGAIARGNEVVIVGDSKQLPPTNFFNTIDDDDDYNDEDFAVDDMESILKECNASGIPRMQLLWHYRSRHESLIAFSNHHYYENRLHTFPSPEKRSAELGVTFRHVADGVYDRGVSRTNRIEASKVVEEVVLRLKGSNTPDSIGVVTFNQAQQSLIEDLLDAKRREMPEIESFFTNEVSEPVFVKNLENVQGDERDTIIFSVGYGPDHTGKPSMNFGPLNKDGGERRLNVAITRARKRLIVFSSLRSDQIDLKRTRSIGVKHFKTFLDYADRGLKAIAEAIDYSGVREFESGFERAVWNALTERGWEVDTQVGCAGYRIDLSVRDPDRPGRYIIGIECDGAAYHSAKTARDRDRLRQSVLEGLGWRIERIWSTEWKINPDHCITVIEQAINDAKRGIPATHNVPTTTTKTATDPEVQERANSQQAKFELQSDPVDKQTNLYTEGSAIPAGPPEYKLATPTHSGLNRLDIFDYSSTTKAVNALGEIVKVEGPILEELAFRSLAEWFGNNRVIERYRDHFRDILAQALQSQPIKNENHVLWPAEFDPIEFTTFRIPGPEENDRRSLEHIPLIERANAVVHVVNYQFGLPREDLIRETAKLFGFNRITSRTREAVGDAIDLAISQGRVECRDGQVSVTEI